MFSKYYKKLGNLGNPDRYQEASVPKLIFNRPLYNLTRSVVGFSDISKYCVSASFISNIDRLFMYIFCYERTGRVK